MKKLVFTALAVVAFSGVSFAGTKEVKNVEEKADKVLAETCAEQATRRTNEQEASSGSCYSSSVYNKIYNLFLSDCKSQ